jgi:hypothetical protein
MRVKIKKKTQKHKIISGKKSIYFMCFSLSAFSGFQPKLSHVYLRLFNR